MHTSKYNQKLATKTERMGRLINENRRQIRKTTPSLINAFCLISSMISNRVQLTQSKHKWIAFPSDLAGWHQFTDVCCRQITGCPVQVAQSMLFKLSSLQRYSDARLACYVSWLDVALLGQEGQSITVHETWILPHRLCGHLFGESRPSPQILLHLWDIRQEFPALTQLT